MLGSKTTALALTLVCLAVAGFGAEADRKILRGHVPPLAAHLTATGRLTATNQLPLAIGLPLRDPAGLHNFLAQLYDPSSPNFRKFLTPEEFTVRFGPTAADYEALKHFAQTNRLKITATHGNRLLLDVTGPAAAVEKAFHISLRTYRHPTEARNFFAPDTEPSIPTGLAILDISGLSDLARARSFLHRRPVSAGTEKASGSGPGYGYIGKDFRNAYAPGSPLNGSGQMVGLFQLTGYNASDIAAYELQAGLTNIPVQNVLLDGYSGTAGGGEDEVCLDIEMAMAMAPGLAKVVVFEAPNNTAYWNDVLNAMAASNQIKQFSSSWGYSGGSPSATSDQIFQEMATQGQSFFQASGDGDAWTNPIWEPSESPYLTVVGGTTLAMSSLGGAYLSEAVWNVGNLGTNIWSPNGNGYWGSGGGVSANYSIPAWQASVNMTTNLGSSTMRNIPDVALTADNVYVAYGGGLSGIFGGTSCAAPLWAGFMALANQQAAAAGRAPIGFINPAIYALGGGTNYVNCFHDTTTGSNTWSGSPTKYFAAAGYDLCTGWGTPNGTNLINALVAQADTLGIFPGYGFSFSGTNGGPFAPGSQIFLLTNSGSSLFGWQMSNAPAWLSVQPTNGFLPAGGQMNVAVSLNSVSSNLAVGSYQASLVFSNLASSATQIRPVNLLVLTPSIVQNGGFETGDFTGWTLAGNGVIGNNIYNAVISAGSLGDNTGTNFIHSGTYGAFLGDNQIATLSQTLSTVSGQRYLLSFWLANPVSGSGQQFLVNWNTNSAGTNQIFFLNNPPVLPWTNLTFVVTAAGTNTTLQFGAANPPNGFGLDDVSAVPIPVPALTRFSRNAGAFTFAWNSLAGVAYQMQYKTNLLQPNWIALGSVTATNNTLTVMDTNANSSSPSRFYRVVELP
jgi:subtilase family serine protease